MSRRRWSLGLKARHGPGRHHKGLSHLARRTVRPSHLYEALYELIFEYIYTAYFYTYDGFKYLYMDWRLRSWCRIRNYINQMQNLPTNSMVSIYNLWGSCISGQLRDFISPVDIGTGTPAVAPRNPKIHRLDHVPGLTLRRNNFPALHYPELSLEAG